MNGLPVSKLSQVRAAWAAGDKSGALAIAAKFPDLGAERGAILSGWGALQNPAFYSQLRRNPDALINAAYKALAARYSLD